MVQICKQHARDFTEIDKEIGEKYKETFFTDKENLGKYREEIKGALSGRFSEEALDCYVNTKIGLGDLTPLILDENLEEIMVIGVTPEGTRTYYSINW